MAFMEYDEMYYIVHREVETIVNVCTQDNDLETPEMGQKRSVFRKFKVKLADEPCLKRCNN